VALRAAPELRRVSLRFTDKAAERRFQGQYFRDNLPYIRAAHAVGIAAWAFFGLYAGQGASMRYELHVVLGYGVAIPLLAASLALTYTRWYARVWQPGIVALVVAISAVAEMHQLVSGHSPLWQGVTDLMLILAVTFTLLRLQYMYAVLAAALVIGYYTATRVLAPHSGGVAISAAEINLVAFAVIGTAAAYVLERFARVLFLRERQLDRERERGDHLLRNILPEAIIGRLKTSDPRTGTRHIAQCYPDVTVLFADLVGFTEQAASTDPEELVTALDDVFSRFDQLADRFGLEKIKTIGDAYMAAAGVPAPRPDHVAAAAAMALEGRECISALRWPSGAPVGVRIGLACGPVMAGVIGRRKFAYDIWGDTVNTASRLESSAVPGTIQVSEAVYERLSAHYLFSEPYVVPLKGKGPTRARTLTGRLPAEPATDPTPGGQSPSPAASQRARS
jgi:class 3 adenylate cyclase